MNRVNGFGRCGIWENPLSMFQLRDGHLCAFNSAAMDNFEQRGVRHLRRRLPRATSAFSDEELRLRVRDGIRRARPYGLTTERQVMCFVDTGFLIGEDFDTRPDSYWARAILDKRDMAADHRAYWLVTGAQRVVRGEGPAQVNHG